MKDTIVGTSSSLEQLKDESTEQYCWRLSLLLERLGEREGMIFDKINMTHSNVKFLERKSAVEHDFGLDGMCCKT
jgi:hypothetical protein